MSDDTPTCPACGEALPPDPFSDPLDTLHLNGETFEFESLTFRERKTVMNLAGELAQVDNPDADPQEDWTRDDMRLAFAIVCTRRTTPDFSVDDGLNLTPEALDAPPTPAPAKRARTRSKA